VAYDILNYYIPGVSCLCRRSTATGLPIPHLGCQGRGCRLLPTRAAPYTPYWSGFWHCLTCTSIHACTFLDDAALLPYPHRHFTPATHHRCAILPTSTATILPWTPARHYLPLTGFRLRAHAYRPHTISQNVAPPITDSGNRFLLDVIPPCHTHTRPACTTRTSRRIDV